MYRPFGSARLALPMMAVAIVVLLTACLGPTSVVDPPAPTDTAAATTTPTATADPTGAPTLTLPPATPQPSPAPTPEPSPWLPSGSPLPPTTAPIPLPTDSPTPQPTSPPDDGTAGLIPTTTGNSRPTRIAVPALNIDLPVIKSNPLYPKCNVAQYLTNFANPGQPGSTYIYGHARTGMFLPLLTQSKINNGAAMIGMLVKVWTADTKLHLYRINIVKRHATDFSLAYDLKPGQHRLIMQTSEGPHGTIAKLQIAARPIGVYESTAAQALPTPHPVTCG